MTRSVDTSSATLTTASEDHAAASDRAQTADDRDRTADAQDASAAARDERSARRDDRAAARDKRLGRVDVEAAADRAGAKRDRRGAANDRKHAADDREAAEVDRQLSAVHEMSLLRDELTGAYLRSAGTRELDLQLIEATNSGVPFVLAFIDIDHLKAVNDAGGHEAGDHLLSRVASSVRGVVRDTDVLVRYGGDEFLCGHMGMTLTDATDRYRQLHADLETQSAASVSIGIVQAHEDEDLMALVARADAAMYESKSLDRSSQPPSAHHEF